MSEEEILSILMQTAPDLDYRSAIPFAKAIERHTLERASEKCSEIESKYWNIFKHGLLDSDFRGDTYTSGQSDAAGECATAIKSMAEKK